MRKVQYKQHQNHYGGDIQIQIFKRVKHECQVKEEEYNRNIFGIQFAILIPMKEWVNKDRSDKLEELDEE